jgi:hypothetical protein
MLTEAPLEDPKEAVAAETPLADSLEEGNAGRWVDRSVARKLPGSSMMQPGTVAGFVKRTKRWGLHLGSRSVGPPSRVQGLWALCPGFRVCNVYQACTATQQPGLQSS